MKVNMGGYWCIIFGLVCGITASLFLASAGDGDSMPPETILVIGYPNCYIKGEYIVTCSTPFILIATDNESFVRYGNEKDPDVEVTFYRIDNGTWNIYEGAFNLSGYPPGYHCISYYSIDKAGNREDEKNSCRIFLDCTPPEINGIINASAGTTEDSFSYNMIYAEDTGKVPAPFTSPTGFVIRAFNDTHVRKDVGSDGNIHLVWMGKPAIGKGNWEIFYKKIMPKGIGIPAKNIRGGGGGGGGGNNTVILIDKTIVPETIISDENSSDSVYPSLVVERKDEVYLNDTSYHNRYALLAAPVRYYIDQQQKLEDGSTWINGSFVWQNFTAGRNYTDIWVDIMIYKDKNLTYKHNITLYVYDVTNFNNPVLIFNRTEQSSNIPYGKQWLAFWFGTQQSPFKGRKYRIVVISKDPYKWYYKSGNPYPDESSLGNSDFAFITRYKYPEIRFKYELSKMRDCLIKYGFNDSNIHFLTIPYFIWDSMGNKVKWRIPGDHENPSIVWQPLPFNFTENWIDGNATYNNVKNAFVSLQQNSTSDDLIFINFVDHGAGKCGGNICGGRSNGAIGDPRILNDEIEDGVDEAFCTYASPNEGFNRLNFWYDDEMDEQLDKMNYKDMVVVIDTCFSGGFIPDLSGLNRIICSSTREDQTGFSYVYRFYERLQDKNADFDGNGFISIREAQEYARQKIPKEQRKGSEAAGQQPQIDIGEYVHVVWCDKRDDNWEIYYSKLGGIVNCSANPNGVDLTSPDWRVSSNDGIDSGRVILPPVDDGINTKFIEHPDIAIDEKKNVSIVWSDKRGLAWSPWGWIRRWEIYYQMQDNAPNGIPATIIDDRRISNPSLMDSDSISPSIAIKNNIVHIAWQDKKTGNWEIMYEKYNPYSNRVIIDDLILSSNDGYDSASPDIDVDENNLPHIVFMDKRPYDPGHENESTHWPDHWEVYTVTPIQIGGLPLIKNEKRQSDMYPDGSYGKHHLPDGQSMYPRVKVSGGLYGDMHITWQDDRYGNWEIFYSCINNFNNNPNADIRVTKNTRSDMYPAMALHPKMINNVGWVNVPDIEWQSKVGWWRIYGADWNDLQSIILKIDGIPHIMLPFNTSDNDSSDGKAYRYFASLPYGIHSYSFYASNGVIHTNTTTVYAPVVEDITPPVTVKSIGEPKTTDGLFVTKSTPFNLTAFDIGSGINATYYRIWQHGIWSKWMKYNGSFNLSGEGKHYLEFYSIDNAGNAENITNQTHYVDDSPPETVIQFGSPHYSGMGNWITSSTPVYLNATDLPAWGSGVKEIHYSYDGTWYVVYGSNATFNIPDESTHTIKYYSIDNVENKELNHSVTVNIDNTPPLLREIKATPSAQLVSHTVNITCKAYDNMGVANLTLHLFYPDGRILNVTMKKHNATSYYHNQSYAIAGNYSYYITAEDFLGNRNTSSIHFFRIYTHPFTSCYVYGKKGKNGWYISRVSIILNGHGGNATYYRINGGKWERYEGGIIEISTEGIHVLQYYSMNNYEVESIRTKTIKIDLSGPSTECILHGSISNGWYVSNVVIEFRVEAMPAGVAYTRYRIDGGAWKTYIRPFLFGKDGEHSMEYYSIDMAGHVEDIKSTTFKIDREPPDVQVIYPNGGEKLSGMATIIWMASDNIGVAGIDLMYSMDAGLKWNIIARNISNTGSYEWNISSLPYGSNYMVKVIARDNAGNTASDESDGTFIIDSPSMPKINIIKPENALYINNRKIIPFPLPLIIGEITIEVNANSSIGIGKVEFYVNGVHKFSTMHKPYSWTWNERGMGIYEIKVIAYDKIGQKAEDRINVSLINL